LLFVDRHGTNVLMELKAVTAKYGNADQLAKYKEALGAKNARNILMWLVAPTIPTIDSGVFGPHRN
jgi:RecB family endonuclease NucS